MEQSSYDLLILSGTYKVEHEKAVIELYGRTKDNKSIVVRVYGFKPYFYVEYVPDILRVTDPKIEHISNNPVKLFVPNGERDYIKVVSKLPHYVPELREKFYKLISGDRYSVLAADIPFYLRFMYDFDLSLFVHVTGVINNNFNGKYNTDIVMNTEVSSSREDITKDPDIKSINPFKPNLRYCSIDIENSIETGMIYVIGLAIWDSGNESNTEVHKEAISIKIDEFSNVLDAERDLLNNFVKKINEIDPDIITGYNIGGYDLPHLMKRASICNIKLKIGRDGSEPYTNTKNERLWRLYGRVFIDAWWEIKMHIRPKQETLEYVSRTYLGDNFRKMDVNRTDIDNEWKSSKDKVTEYCINDAYLALEILKKLKRVEMGIDMGIVSKLNLDDSINGRTSLFIDSLLIREADRNMIGVPMNFYNSDNDEQIEGGYVHEMKPGIYNWIVVLDFKSMYPSIIISKNICFTTLNQSGTIKSPVENVNFLSKDVKVGLIPTLLSRLMKERDEHKRQMDITTDSNERRYHDGLQYTIKILMNSFYGVFASSFYRFTDKKIGGSITSFARSEIRNVIDQIEKNNYEIIYSDTDSVFVNTKASSLDESVSIGTKFSDMFSKGGATLEFQYVMKSFYSHGKKKRYIGRVVWPKEMTIVRGYEMRRTDSFDYQSYALSVIFDTILDGNSDKLLEKARELINNVREGKVGIEKLVISRSVREDIDTYKEKDSIVSLNVYNALKKRGYTVIPGMKVSWIVTDASKTPQKVEPYIEGEPLNAIPDYEYYAKRVSQTIARATEPFGYTEEVLMRGTTQKTFKTFDNIDSESIEKTDKSRVIKKSSNLDDFI